MVGLWFKALSSINERNVIIQARSIALEVKKNLMEDLTKELRNIRDEWPQLKLHLKQKYEHYPTFP
jgi:phosphatidylserine/phosphatidylglycerophosphate/cardiolipin synthase-like enzyme